MEMRFGDWQLFKSAIKALKVREEEIIEGAVFYGDFTPVNKEIRLVEEDRLSDSMLSVARSESISSQDNQMSRPKHQPIARQTSVDSTKSGYQGERGKFQTISEEKEFAAPVEKPLKRKDSAIQQVEFESGLLHNAMMLSFAEEEEEENDETNGPSVSDELLIQPSSLVKKEEDKEKRREKTRPVRFTLGGNDSIEIEGEEIYSPDKTSDRSPLLEKKSMTSLPKSLSTSLEKLVRPKMSPVSSLKSLPGSKGSEGRQNQRLDTAGCTDWNISGGSVGFPYSEDKDAVYFINENKSSGSERDSKQDILLGTVGDRSVVSGPLDGQEVWVRQGPSRGHVGHHQVAHKGERSLGDKEAQV